MRIVTLSRWKVTCISCDRNLHLLIVDLGRKTCGSCHSFENNDHNLTLRRIITSCTNCQSWEKNYHLYIMWANCMSLMEYHLSVRTVTLVTRTATTDLWKLSPLWKELPPLTCENCYPCEKNCHYLPVRTVILVRRTATTYLGELSHLRDRPARTVSLFSDCSHNRKGIADLFLGKFPRTKII